MIRKLILKTFIAIVICGFNISCSQEVNSFSTSPKELINILEKESSRKKFIDHWQMNLCHESEMSTNYCYQDTIIQLEVVEDGNGYMLSINNLEFSYFDKLTSELEKSYNSQDIREIEGYEKHLGMYDLAFSQIFTNKEYEIAVIAINSKPNNTYSITVNKLNN